MTVYETILKRRSIRNSNKMKLIQLSWKNWLTPHASRCKYAAIKMFGCIRQTGR